MSQNISTANSQHAAKPRCRCYINARYTSRAWAAGKLPQPCPVPGHDEDLKASESAESVVYESRQAAELERLWQAEQAVPQHADTLRIEREGFEPVLILFPRDLDRVVEGKRYYDSAREFETRAQHERWCEGCAECFQL